MQLEEGIEGCTVSIPVDMSNGDKYAIKGTTVIDCYLNYNQNFHFGIYFNYFIM